MATKSAHKGKTFWRKSVATISNNCARHWKWCRIRIRQYLHSKEPVAAAFTQWVIYRRTLKLWHMMNEWCGGMNVWLEYTKQPYPLPANTISRLTNGPIFFSRWNVETVFFSYDSRHLIMLNGFWPFSVWNWATISRMCFIAVVGFHCAFNELEKVFSRSNSNSNSNTLY